jgi:hypothetical protein
MSDQDRETHGTHGAAHGAHGAGHGGHPPAEEDVVASARIVWVGVISLAVFLVGSLAAGAAMVSVRRSVNPEGPAAVPADAGQAKIGIVEQRLFENANQGTAWREQARLRLRSTGWVDRQKGVVHVPIDGAMERVVRGERP